MTERQLRLVTVVLALLGAAIAGYLGYTRLTTTSIMCPTSGCATVARSTYSELANVPVVYIGIVGYLAIALTAASGRLVVRRLGTVLVIGAAGFALYLLVAQVFLLGAVCVWCLGSDLVLALLLGVTALRYRAQRGRV